MRAILRDRLHALGYTARSVSSGRIAIALVHEEATKGQPIDGILLDLDVPNIDGMSVLHLMRAQHPQIPIIMMSVADNVNRLRHACRQGAADYLLKPIDPEMLKE